MDFIAGIAEWLNKSPWLNFLSMAVGLVSLLLSIYFYVRSKASVLPKYQTSGISLLSQGARAVRGLQIAHNGTNLVQLSVSTVSFWNQGNKVLEPSAVASADPLRIKLPDGTMILQANVAHQTSLGNQVALTLRMNESVIDISFDYFARNEGFTAEIFHDARFPDSASVLGTIKGFGHPQEVMETDDPISDNYVRPIMDWVWDKTGGPKRLWFWVLSPIYFIPLLVTIIIDLSFKPLRLLRGPSSSLNAYKHVKRYRE